MEEKINRDITKILNSNKIGHSGYHYEGNEDLLRDFTELRPISSRQVSYTGDDIDDDQLSKWEKQKVDLWNEYHFKDSKKYEFLYYDKK